jgi:hypothetical protein
MVPIRLGVAVVVKIEVMGGVGFRVNLAVGVMVAVGLMVGLVLMVAIGPPVRLELPTGLASWDF